MPQSCLVGISLRGLQALGAISLKWYCAAKGLQDRNVREGAEYLWQFCTATDICAWNCEPPDLIETGLGYEFPEPTKQTVRDKGIEQEFRRLLECVVEISFSNMYAAVNIQEAREYLREAFNILHKHQIAAPPTDAFKVSSDSDLHSWGEPVSKPVVFLWREIARKGSLF